MKRGILILSAVLAGCAGPAGAAEPLGRAAGATSWPDLIHKPYERLPTPDIGLKPLLLTEDGRAITTQGAWERQRRALRTAWLRRLGAPPARPGKLDIKVETRDVEPDHVRQLVSFAGEGGDRIRAYLLLPKDLRGGQKRPAVVVFHPTTKETLREPVGLGTRPEMALALQLVRRGYVTLSPECYIMKGGGPRPTANALQNPYHKGVRATRSQGL